MSSAHPTRGGVPAATLRLRRGIPLGRSPAAVGLAAAGVVALGAELAAAASARSLPADPGWTPVALAVGAFALAAFLRPFEPAPGEKLSLAAAAAFFGALVLPGAFAVAAVAAAALAAKLAQRRSALSTAVNVAQAAGATGAAALTAGWLGGGPGILAAAASYAAVTLGSVAVMVTAAQSAPAGIGSLRREGLPTLALVAVGGIASVAWRHEPLVLLLFVPLLATIELASRRAAAERAAAALREEAERAQRDFAMDAAHELRTPLASVIGELDYIRSPRLEGTEEAALEAARAEVRRAARIVDRLLVLARAGSAGQGPADLAEAVRRAVATAAARTAVPIETHVPEELRVALASELLDVLVGDLVQNAASYTREGRIEIEARRAGAVVEIDVRDTGIGIAPEELPRIFDRFYRGARARAMAPGSGLGLAIVREILVAHGGAVEVTSASRGTTVTARIPPAR